MVTNRIMNKSSSTLFVCGSGHALSQYFLIVTFSKADLDITRFLSCDTLDCISYETKRNCRGLYHLSENGPLAIQSLTLHDFSQLCFPAIRHNLTDIFEHVQNVTIACDLRFFGLHGVITTSAS